MGGNTWELSVLFPTATVQYIIISINSSIGNKPYSWSNMSPRNSSLPTRGSLFLFRRRQECCDCLAKQDTTEHLGVAVEAEP